MSDLCYVLEPFMIHMESMDGDIDGIGLWLHERGVLHGWLSLDLIKHGVDITQHSDIASLHTSALASASISDFLRGVALRLWQVVAEHRYTPRRF
jgi:hypothetical protein